MAVTASARRAALALVALAACTRAGYEAGQRDARDTTDATRSDGRTSDVDSPSGCPVAPASGLIAHFRMDESGGTQAVDSAGGAPGAVNGPVWRPTGGKIGGAIELDGVDDLVEVDQRFKSTLSSFSVSVWVRARGPLSSSVPVFSALNGDNLYPRVWILASGDMMFQLSISGKVRADALRPTIPLDSWQQLLVTFDQQAGNRYTCYVNGVKQGEEDFPDGTVDGGSSTMLIGKDRSPVLHYGGLLDDLRVYDRALGPQEVRALFDAPGCQP